MGRRRRRRREQIIKREDVVADNQLQSELALIQLQKRQAEGAEGGGGGRRRRITPLHQLIVINTPRTILVFLLFDVSCKFAIDAAYRLLTADYRLRAATPNDWSGQPCEGLYQSNHLYFLMLYRTRPMITTFEYQKHIRPKFACFTTPF